MRDDNTQSGAAIHNVEVRKLVVPKVSHATLTNEAFSVGSKTTATAARLESVGRNDVQIQARGAGQGQGRVLAPGAAR